MKTPEQLKGAIRNIAKDKNLRSVVGIIGRMLTDEDG